MKIVAVCGVGIGTSAILKVNAERALERLGLVADVDASDLAAWRNQFGAQSMTSIIAAEPTASQSTAAAVVAADEHAADMQAAEVRITALDAIYAGGDFTSLLAERPSFRPLGKTRLRPALR